MHGATLQIVANSMYTLSTIIKKEKIKQRMTKEDNVQ